MHRALSLLLLVFAPAIARADPCTAIPDRGAMPSYLKSGRTFTGPVVYVGDGDSLCVAAVAGRARDPATWVEVRIADFYAPELHEPGGAAAKAVLEGQVQGRTLQCLAQKRSYDRVVARCRLEGVSLGERLRRAGAAEGGRGR